MGHVQAPTRDIMNEGCRLHIFTFVHTAWRLCMLLLPKQLAVLSYLHDERSLHIAWWASGVV